MNLSDLVIILVIFTFFPFNEGIIAKSPLWKKLADSFEFGLIKTFTWRANANVTNELEVLTHYFKRASFISCFAFVISLFILKSQPLLLWSSLICLLCFFAWFSFKWTFNHREAIQPLAPMIGYSLLGPWFLLLLDYLSPNVGMMKALAQPLAFLPYNPSTSLGVATKMFLLFVTFFGFYYIFGWLLLSPFAYCVLAGLKVSRNISAFLIRRFNRNLLYEISVTVQIFGVVYFYLHSRQS